MKKETRNGKLQMIERMEEQQKILAARIERLKNAQKADEQKKDTRRKILAGAHLIALCGGDIKKVGAVLFKAGCLAERDFALFDFELPENRSGE